MPKNFLQYEDLFIPKVKTVDTPLAKIAYREMGKGEAILMLPSWPANSIEYIPLMNMMHERYKCIAIDFPNWTGKSSSEEKYLGIDDYVNIIKQFIVEKDLEKIHLIGYSFSVPIATILKQQNPEVINKVILISGFMSGRDLYNRFPTLINIYKRLKFIVPEKIASYLVRKIMFSTYKHTLYYKKYKNVPLFTEFFDMLKELKFKRALHSIIETTSRDYTPLFRETYKEQVPLLLWAEKDPDFVRSSMKKLDEMIGSPDFTVFDSDHNHVAFDVERSAEVIKKFMNL